MLVEERYDKIVQLVNERGSIRVTELSELCNVTEETIRRDLSQLEGLGRLKRSHGGAVRVKEASPIQPEVSYIEREVQNTEEKMRIAEAAIQCVQPRERILLDASTTAWYVARSLPDMPLTVLTNSVRVAATLAGKEKIEVISTGGLLAHRSLSYIGPLAERALESYYVDKLFLSCKGAHLERGISESNELQGIVKQKMISIADRTILLADASKFNVQSFTLVADWSQIHHVISDKRLDETIQTQLKERNVSVTIA